MMAVIGIDSHKDTLAACLADETGRAAEHRSFDNTPDGCAGLVAWAQAAGAERVGIEGSGNYGRPAALALIEANLAVVEVPPQMTAAARKGQRTGTKSDPVDALLVARIAGRDEDLPPPRPDGALEDLRSTVRYRRELVKARNQHVNRLHADLEQTRLGYHREIPSKLTGAKALAKASRLLSGHTSTKARIARLRIRHIRELNRQIDDLAKEIAELVNDTETGAALRGIYGVGPLVAADIIAETGDPARFATKARYATANGTAPIAASSGRIQRHRLNRGGNRQLNKAIHTAALAQIAKPGTEGHRYYHRCLQRGKTKREAIRALKRKISDRIYTTLQTTPKLT